MTFTFLDVVQDGNPLGRIVIRLDTDLAERASQNFLELCKGEKEVNGIKLTFKGNTFHRVVKNFMIQAGDIVNGHENNYPNQELGKGGASIFASEADTGLLRGTFKDENLKSFETPMIVAMANIGKDTNCSQFFISTSPSPHLNGLHSIFGSVVYGKSVVREIEKADTNKDDVPKHKIVISNCGEWNEGDDIPIFNACYDQIAGDVYEEYPDDETKIDESTMSAYNATNIIKESGSLLFKKNEKSKALLKYQKALRYCNEFIPDNDSEYYQKFIELKKKLFLNLSLTCLNLKNYEESIKYCNFLIEMSDILKPTPAEAAKTYYRRGTSFAFLKKLDRALEDLNEAQKLLPDDKLITDELLKIDRQIKEKKQKEKLKYSKFFG